MDLLQGAMYLLQIQFKVHLHVQKLQGGVFFKLPACERVGWQGKLMFNLILCILQTQLHNAP